MKKNKLTNLLIIILLSISIFFGLKAYYEYHNLKESEKLYDEIAKIVEAGRENNTSSEDMELIEISEYWDLYQRNSDFLAWIKIDGTRVDYPIMHTPNEPEKYLRKDFNENYSIPGTIFMDYRNDLNSDNLIIYGHYMENGTMFGDLTKFLDKDFLESHQIINFDTLESKSEYEIFSVFHDHVRNVDDNSFKYYNVIDIEEDEYQNVIKILKDKSEVKVDVDIKEGDQLMMLSTCSYHQKDGRFVVVAHKIK